MDGLETNNIRTNSFYLVDKVINDLETNNIYTKIYFT